MKPILPFILSVLFFAGCMPMVSYVGNKMPPATEDVQVYVDPAAIGRPYAVMGKGYLNYPVGLAFTSYEKMQRSAVALARKNGAHAVLIHDWIAANPQTRISTSISRDTSGRATGSETVMGPAVQHGMEILFLRFR